MTENSSAAARPQKIVILGGGIAALTTAFELTSQPGWQARYDITLHTLGWRLGGKCASSRGPNGRIQEHGIHAFMGSYYNTMPMMAACYEELGRKPDAPLATYEQAFLPDNFILMWEWRDGALRRWPLNLPANARSPTDATAFVDLGRKADAVLQLLHAILEAHEPEPGPEKDLLDRTHGLVGLALRALASGAAHGLAHPFVALFDKAWGLLGAELLKLADSSDMLRRMFITVDFMLAMVRGLIADDVGAKGYDHLDDQNWSDWLLAHGAHKTTVSSPLAINTINLSYQYPQGDTALSPRMGAGCYVHWTLRAFAYSGSMVYLFAAGCGETVIAPLYLVLKQRGVKFEFFHKVEALKLGADGRSIGAVEIAVQAHLKQPESGYDPLIEVKGLPSWPDRPLYDQLVEGDALKGPPQSQAALDGNAPRTPPYDLESYWTPWEAPDHTTLTAGVDYDRLVFAISIGAIPFLCRDLLGASPAWVDMVTNIPTVQTQQLQLWLSKDVTELGWDLPMKGTDAIVSDTYLNPGDGQAELGHLIAWEDWPADNQPRSLWYFCGLFSDHYAPPPFSDHDYPGRAFSRMRFGAIQYLQAGIGPLLPGATCDAQNPPGDPVGFDFSLLVMTEETMAPTARLNTGAARIESQYMRVNIDPSERYVTSPPGSTRYRLKAWESGFSNLVLAGDWIYTGLNVGSVEGTVMGGKLAAHAISGSPSLDAIIDYPVPAQG